MSMAKSISEEELQLRTRARRRLVGAIALVTMVAVFLPMVLDHEPRSVNQDISIQIPSPNSGNFTTKIASSAPAVSADLKPVPADMQPQAESPEKSSGQAVSGVQSATTESARSAVTAKAEPAAQPEHASKAAPSTKAPSAKGPVPSKSAPPSKPVPSQTPVAPAPSSTEAPAPLVVAVKPQAQPVTAVNDSEAAPVKSSPTEHGNGTAKNKSAVGKSKAGGGFVVQVAALNDVDKARQMQEQIVGAGVRAYTEVVPTAKGNVTRVRAGPFRSRAEADKARDKLHGLGLNGNVVPK